MNAQIKNSSPKQFYNLALVNENGYQEKVLCWIETPVTSINMFE